MGCLSIQWVEASDATLHLTMPSVNPANIHNIKREEPSLDYGDRIFSSFRVPQ